MPEPLATSLPNALVSILVVGHPMPLITTRIPAIRHHHPVSAHETLKNITTIIMRTSEGDMRMMLLLWDATPGNRSLKIVEIPIKTTLNNPDFPEK